MKMNKFFMGLGAVAALSLAACSNEEPAVNNEDGAATGEGSTAYMKVVINATNSSRATSGDSDFEQGTDEQAVDKANFYFYTKEGAYVTTAEVWNGGTPDTSNPAVNVEFRGNTVLVLKDLNEEKAPAYIVTVLNEPDNFTHGETLAEMEAKLALAAENADGYAYEKNSTKYFTMSTSSYIRTSPENNYEYFTTKVNPANFLKYSEGETPTQAQIDALSAVEIYVERLAVKVRVNYATGTLTNKVTIGEKTYFKLTVSGGNVVNDAEGYTVPIADTDLYLAIEGWGLNNLTQNSYLMKNLTDKDAASWHNGASGSAATLFRNYWAKAATIYGVSTPDPLMHYSLNDHMTGSDFNNTVGTSAYCFENTNTADVLKVDNNLGNLATSAMIYARIYQRAADDTMTPATMVSYNGIMFTEADFKALILNALQTSVKYYAKTTVDDADVYTQIAATDIQFNKVAGSNKGEVTVTLTTEAEGKNWYSHNGTEYSSVTATAINTAISAIISNIASHVYVYNGGLMYYNVPIEHYRNATPQTPLEEGDYGVVRNHIYDLSITGVTKLGKAIYDPDQDIIPDTPTNEDRYALGVRVNILSWKIVNQSVNL